MVNAVVCTICTEDVYQVIKSEYNGIKNFPVFEEPTFGRTGPKLANAIKRVWGLTGSKGNINSDHWEGIKKDAFAQSDDEIYFSRRITDLAELGSHTLYITGDERKIFPHALVDVLSLYERNNMKMDISAYDIRLLLRYYMRSTINKIDKLDNALGVTPSKLRIIS